MSTAGIVVTIVVCGVFIVPICLGTRLHDIDRKIQEKKDKKNSKK